MENKFVLRFQNDNYYCGVGYHGEVGWVACEDKDINKARVFDDYGVASLERKNILANYGYTSNVITIIEVKPIVTIEYEIVRGLA